MNMRQNKNMNVKYFLLLKRRKKQPQTLLITRTFINIDTMDVVSFFHRSCFRSCYSNSKVEVDILTRIRMEMNVLFNSNSYEE